MGAQYSSIKYPGYAYLYSGATGALIRTFSLSGGAHSEIGYGSSVAVLPDVDGDGLQDIAVGKESSVLGNNSDVYIYSSATGNLLQAIPPFFPGTYSGWAREIAGVEDLNGDGRGEILIGDPSNNRAFVYSAIYWVGLYLLKQPV